MQTKGPSEPRAHVSSEPSGAGNHGKSMEKEHEKSMQTTEKNHEKTLKSHENPRNPAKSFTNGLRHEASGLRRPSEPSSTMPGNEALDRSGSASMALRAPVAAEIEIV